MSEHNSTLQSKMFPRTGPDHVRLPHQIELGPILDPLEEEDIENNYNANSQLLGPDDAGNIPQQAEMMLPEGLSAYFVFVVLANLWTYLDHWIIGSVQLFADYSEPQMEVVWVLPSTLRCFFACTGLVWELIPLRFLLPGLTLTWATLANIQYFAANSAVTVFILRMSAALSTALLISVPVCLAGWVPRRELATKMGIFTSMAPLATSVGSLPISEIVHFADGYWTQHWALIYLFAGIPPLITCLFIPNLALSSLLCVPMSVPSTTENAQNRRERRAPFLRRVGRVVLDPKNYLLALAFWAVHMTFAPNPCIYGAENQFTFTYVPRFLYKIGVTLSSSFETFHMAVFAPYFVAIFATLVITKASDRVGNRSKFVCIQAGVSGVCFGVMSVTAANNWNPWIIYVAAFPVTAGYFTLTSLIITWAMNNEESLFSRMVVICFFAIMAELGTQLSPNGVYPYFRTQYEWTDPLYIKVHILDTAMMALVGTVSYGLYRYLRRENRKLPVKSWNYAQQSAEGDRTEILEYIC